MQFPMMTKTGKPIVLRRATPTANRRIVRTPCRATGQVKVDVPIGERELRVVA